MALTVLKTNGARALYAKIGYEKPITPCRCVLRIWEENLALDFR